MSTDVRPRIQYLSFLNTAVSPRKEGSVTALDRLGVPGARDHHPQESSGTARTRVGPTIPRVQTRLLWGLVLMACVPLHSLSLRHWHPASQGGASSEERIPPESMAC